MGAIDITRELRALRDRLAVLEKQLARLSPVGKPHECPAAPHTNDDDQTSQPLTRSTLVWQGA